MKKLYLLFIATLCFYSASATSATAASAAASATPATPATDRPYGGIFEGITNLETSSGEFITLRKTRDKLWMELPVRYLGRAMLMGSTLSDISAPLYGTVGYKEQRPLHIRFSLQDSLLHMHQINSAITTDYIGDAMRRVVSDPIYFSFPVEAWGAGKNSVVVQLSDFLLDSPSFFSFFSEDAITFSPTFNKESSSFGAIKSFADNCSIESTLVFTVSAEVGGAQLATDAPVTARVTRSILLLPEERMTPRISDSRVGVFSTDKTRYSVTDEGSRTYSVANRWRVVPNDIEAYARGEMVEPTKRIVFYIDPAFPENWKAPLKRAVEVWNRPFEAIGFRNVLEARPYPSPEEDPAFDPDNLKYSCIRFLPSTTINAMGPSWVDPATGEVITASVIVWSDVAKLANTWRFVQTSQVDPRARTKKLPDELFAPTLQYIVAHEIGHTLGFAHSMASSNAWPVDSLRSPTFTRKYGTTPSIMDYARFNYIAQPSDVGVTLTPPEIGVHDNFLVKWTYQYIPPARDGWNEWDEAPIVERWVDAVADNPVHRYGRQQFGAARYDPTAIEEDLGDNAIRAGNYGIANLKYILSHLREWITDDTDYRHRQMLYGEICDQYFRYIRAVAMNVGGIRLTVVKEGTRGTHIAPVSHELQRASLHWVIDQLRDMEWLDAPTLTRNFDLGTGGAAGIRGRVLELFRGMLPKVILSSHYAHHPYTIREFTNDLFHATWRGARRHPPTAADRALQREMVAMFCEPLTAMEASATETAISLQSLTSFESERRFGPGGMMVQDEVDVSAIDDSADYLTELAVRSRDYLERVTRHSRRGTHVHYHALLMKLNLALKDKY